MRPLAIVALLAALALAAGCSAPAKGPTVLQPNAEGKYEIHMVGLAFQPKMAQVPANATVVWVLDSGGPHDVQSDDHASFSSGPSGGMKAAGATYERRFEKAGTYAYHCDVHHSVGMAATLVVA